MSKYLTAILTLSVSLFGVPSLAQEDTPNVLFIMIDDLRPELGAYGKKIIKSPNIVEISGMRGLKEVIGSKLFRPSCHIYL